MIIKKYKNLIDCFTDIGWENHTRFSLNKKTLQFISGKTLSKSEFILVKKYLKLL